MQDSADTTDDPTDPFAPGRVPADAFERQTGRGRGHVLLVVRNMPTPETVEGALRLRPQCADLVRWWSDAWTSILSSLSPTVEPVQEGDSSMHAARAAPFMPASADADHGPTTALAAYAERVRELHAAMATGERDWRHHVVEDADALRSVSTDAEPFRATFLVRGEPLTFAGNGPDGFPVLRRTHDLPWAARRRVRDAVDAWNDEPLLYWNLPGFMAHAGRDFAECPHPASAAYAVLAMARRGDGKAFLKGMASKSGTWTVDLSGVRDSATAWASVAGAMWPSTWPNDGILVQEHLPSPEEQRFFVVDGRVAASVCSDRGICRPDGRDRILDDRVAVLRRPETASGVFDRGETGHRPDRGTAAALARKARTVVRDLARDGILDYVLDVGMTARGPVAIELNALVNAGPYCLDRRRHVRAVMRQAPPEARPTLRYPIRDAEDGLLPSAADALDRVASSLSPDAELLASVPFVVAGKGRFPMHGRFLVLSTSGSISCYAAGIEEGRIVVEPAGARSGADGGTIAQRVLSRRPDWPEDGTSRRMLFDDGTVRLHGTLEDRGGVRLLVLERTIADEPCGSLVVGVAADAVFAPHPGLDSRRGPVPGPRVGAWRRTVTMTFTASSDGGTSATWTPVDGTGEV